SEPAASASEPAGSAGEPAASELEAPVSEPGPADPAPEGPGPTDGAAGDAQNADQTVTVVPGVPRYHRSDCILIRFMGDNDLQRMSLEAAQGAGCTPCRACQEV
ncbi:MAG TPA: hypothetical protein VGN41_13720, partial [Streptosporangiaceae bacterium]